MRKRNKKISSFWDYDGGFYYYCGKIFDVVILGILWLIGCIPVITIGTSFTALYSAIHHSVKNDRESFGKEFWKAYKRNFKASLPILLIIMAVVFIMFLNIGILYQNMRTRAGLFFAIMYAVVAAVFVLAGCYIFPALSRFDMPTGWLFKLAFVMVFRHLPYTIFLGILFVIAYLLVLKYMVLILIVPGIAVWVGSLIIDPLLDRYMLDTDA